MPAHAAALQLCAFKLPPCYVHDVINPPRCYCKKTNAFQKMFKPKDTVHRKTKPRRSLHNRELIHIRDKPFLDIETRSALKFNRIYNQLHNDIVMVENNNIFN